MHLESSSDPRFGNTIEGTPAELEMIRDLCAAALAAGENATIQAERPNGKVRPADGHMRELRARLIVRMEREEQGRDSGMPEPLIFPRNEPDYPCNPDEETKESQRALRGKPFAIQNEIYRLAKHPDAWRELRSMDGSRLGLINYSPAGYRALVPGSEKGGPRSLIAAVREIIRSDQQQEGA